MVSTTHSSTLTSPTPLWLIDSNIYIYRAWLGKTPLLLDAAGHPINAVRHFLRWVYHLLSTEKPHVIAFAFDAPQSESLRRALYPLYKAHRTPTPDALKYQFQLCWQFLNALGFITAKHSAYEADDIIGTWVAQHPQQLCHIISGDKDLMQLVRDHDLWWDYGRRAALNQGKIKRTTGVWPKQIPDQLALAGDEVDNIAGIDGIGLATAAKLLHRFTSIEGLLLRLPELTQLKLCDVATLQTRLQQQADQIRLAKQLTRIRCDVPDLPTDLTRQPKDLALLKTLCTQLALDASQYELWAEI